MITFGSPMEYIDQPLVGDGQCVKLVQDAMSKVVYGPNTPNGDQFNTRNWRAGTKVKDAISIAPGTLIATFDKDGKYPNLSTGNHAAIYMYRDETCITVIDQYKTKPSVGTRKIRYKSPEEIKKEGDNYKMSNDANCYYTINLIS